MKQGVVVACAGMLLLSGCIGSDEADDEPAAPTALDTFGNPTDAPILAGLPERADERTLATAPEWRLGEWWRVRVTDELAGGTNEVTRIVAGIEGDQYLVAMPHDEFVTPIMVLHVPGFGQVGRADLSFEIHDVRFEPLRFPLIDGTTWETSFEGRPITATVTVTSPTTAEIDMVGANDHLVATYDAAIGELSRLHIEGYGTMEVLDHGYGWEGIGTVPHMHDVIFFNFRVAGALGPGLQPGPPIETVQVDTTYDRVSFAIILAPLSADQPLPGVFHERVTAPNGSVYEGMASAADGPGWKLFYFSHDQPGGSWQLQHLAGGAGIAGVEGIAYHVYDVELPSGRILPSQGEHEHGGA